MALGPVLGGVLVTSAGWRSIFWINIPVGMVAARARPALHSRSPGRPKARRIDRRRPSPRHRPAGLADLRHHRGSGPRLGSPADRGRLCLAVVALVALLRWEPRREEPLIDIRFFRSIPFAAATLIAIAAFASLGRLSFPQHPLPPGRARPLAAARRARHAADGGHDDARCRRSRAGSSATRGSRIPLVIAGSGAPGQLSHAGPDQRHDPVLVAVRRLRRVRNRLRARERAHHQRRRVRHAPGSGRSGGGDRLDVASGWPDPRRGRGRCARDLEGRTGRSTSGLAAASHVGWWTLAGCGAVVLVLGIVATSRRALESARRTARELNPEMLVSRGTDPDDR